MKKIMLALILSLSVALAADREIVTEDIVVNAGDTLRFTPGKKLLFDGYTGITVKGHLRVVGTREQPVVFASVNSTKNAATSFDWNGIEITDGGSAEFIHSVISNATSGITAENAQSLTLTECIFKDNGQWHLSIAGEIQDVLDGEPYSLRLPLPPPAVIPSPAEFTAPESAATAPTVATEQIKDKDSRRAWRWVLGGVGTAAAIGGSVSLYRADTIKKDYHAYKEGNGDFDAATPEERQQRFDKLRKDHKTAQTLGWSLFGAAAADFLVLIFLF